jgi:hypothetical protein
MWALNIPLRPPNTKKYIKLRRKQKPTSKVGLDCIIVTHQCRTLVDAGTDIITVIVLYRVRTLFARPTMYIWCPQTAKPMKAIVYIENCRDNLPDNLLRR